MPFKKKSREFDVIIKKHNSPKVLLSKTLTEEEANEIRKLLEG